MSHSLTKVTPVGERSLSHPVRRLVLGAIGRVSSGTLPLESAGHVFVTRHVTRSCPPPDAVGLHANDLLEPSSLGQLYLLHEMGLFSHL
jgi:hypothetical protein